MKRSLPPNFDPVYPYNDKPLLIIPPFYDNNGFAQNGAVFQLKIDSPLGFSNNGNLILNLGAGLIINSQGQLEAEVAQAIQTTPPLSINGNLLTLQLGDTLTINTNNELDTSLSVKKPLKLVNNSIEVEVGDGLQIENDQLQAALGSGLTIANGKIAAIASSPLVSDELGLHITVSDGIEIRNDALALKTGAGLTTTNEGINVRVSSDGGLGVSTNGVGVNVGSGLFVNSQNQLEASTGSTITASNPLELQSGNMVFKHNQPFYIVGGKLSLALNPPLIVDTRLGTLGIDFDFFTLWSTPDPPPNVLMSPPQSSTQPNAKLICALSKIGGMVMGYVAIHGVSEPFLSLRDEAFSLDMKFGADGRIDFTNSNLKSNWGPKKLNSYDPTSSINRLLFMPNTLSYPRSGNNTTQFIETIVYLNGQSNQPVKLRIALNTLIPSDQDGFSIEFKWSALQLYPNQLFTTSIGRFMYLAQE